MCNIIKYLTSLLKWIDRVKIAGKHRLDYSCIILYERKYYKNAILGKQFYLANEFWQANYCLKMKMSFFPSRGTWEISLSGFRAILPLDRSREFSSQQKFWIFMKMNVNEVWQTTSGYRRDCSVSVSFNTCIDPILTATFDGQSCVIPYLTWPPFSSPISLSL